MKICCVCHKSLPEEDFNKNKARKDGLNNICKYCSRERSKQYYRENKDSHRLAVYNRRKKRKQENIPKILAVLSQGCSSCSEKDIRVLDFHHLGNKRKGVTVMLNEGYSWDEIEKEISKCVILCSNCHRKQNSKQRKSWRNMHL